MKELIIYSVLLLAVLGHCFYVIKMYKEVNKDKSLTFHQKNDWKLKALIFPAYFLQVYRKGKKG